jgi:hypothetical protein
MPVKLRRGIGSHRPCQSAVNTSQESEFVFYRYWVSFFCARLRFSHQFDSFDPFNVILRPCRVVETRQTYSFQNQTNLPKVDCNRTAGKKVECLVIDLKASWLPGPYKKFSRFETSEIYIANDVFYYA